MDNEKIQFDAILLCETFLSDKNHDLFNIPGYTFISRHRKHYRQGGVGIYIKNNINFVIRDDLSIFIEKCFETLFIEVTSSKGNIIIGEVYRVPNSSCPDSITNYELLTNKLQKGTDQLEYLRSGILVADISDHFPIFVFTGNNVRHCKPKNNTNSYRKLDATAIERINTLLLATDWSPLQHLNNYILMINLIL